METTYNFLLDLALILLTTKILGLVTRRYNMPQVVGALLAGLLMGPACLNILHETTFIHDAAEIGVVVLMLVLRPSFKAMIFSFILPVIFAFTVSMTPDIAVNHKYIIIATIFLNIFFAYAIVRLWKDWRGILTKCIAVILIVLLTVTGAYDLLTIYNSDKNAVGIDLDSKLSCRHLVEIKVS